MNDRLSEDSSAIHLPAAPILSLSQSSPSVSHPADGHLIFPAELVACKAWVCGQEGRGASPAPTVTGFCRFGTIFAPAHKTIWPLARAPRAHNQSRRQPGLHTN